MQNNSLGTRYKIARGPSAIEHVDLELCRHMASLGHKVLTHCGIVTPYGVGCLC